VHSWVSWAYVFSPLAALAVIGVLVLILRWAFSSGTSLVEHPPRQGHPNDYGLLNVVSAPGTYIEAEISRRQLEHSGVNATVAMTNDGPRVMVWPEDEARAKQLLRQRDE
jgi:hypothetical protein